MISTIWMILNININGGFWRYQKKNITFQETQNVFIELI